MPGRQRTVDFRLQRLPGLLEKRMEERGARGGQGQDWEEGGSEERREPPPGLALPGSPAIRGQDCVDPALQGWGAGERGGGGRPLPPAPPGASHTPFTGREAEAGLCLCSRAPHPKPGVGGPSDLVPGPSPKPRPDLSL
ncbi:unnamed protein product [Rangifer tarandus platyrhynchus]|uniref:Uncharacterized protein n=2 Tax=Rangifer tarandus platyrhynchus TaxID=3082113 RepID=A0ABN8ZFG5_RANTA|nr:unnamed protein product [Rangifer tarandus platyrhynchus]CAI9708556.1 unnamed protein product [Rangifer tarandus platyrhynchus]